MYPEKNKVCSCHESGVCLDIRHASWVIAALILVSFGFFIVGYFMGKRTVIQDLHGVAHQDSLADQIYTSLYTRQDGKISVAQQNSELLDEVAESQCEISDQKSDESVDAKESVVGQLADNTKLSMGSPQKKEGALPQELQSEQEKYYAQLVGFGTLKAAEKFAQRLQKNNIPVVVKHRYSKTAKGKKITWYQVVTKEVQDKNHLEKMVDEVKTKERLKDVRIVTC